MAHERRIETLVFVAEAITMAAVSTVIHGFKGHDRPNWLVPEIMVGCIISGLPAIVLARLNPTTWQDYERRAITGFCVALGVVGPWQLWQIGQRMGEERGYSWSNHDKKPSLERPA